MFLNYNLDLQKLIKNERSYTPNKVEEAIFNLVMIVTPGSRRN